MLNRRFGILHLLAFVPQILMPTGLYLAGDKHIFSVKTIDGIYEAYRVPGDEKGGFFTINEKTDTPIHIYVNKDKKNFDKKMNPPAPEDLEIDKNLVSLSDKKLIGIVHYLFTAQMPSRRISISNTAEILTYIDEAIQIRTGKQSKYTIPQNKWNTIREALEEAIMTKELKIESAKASLAPIQVNNDSDQE